MSVNSDHALKGRAFSETKQCLLKKPLNGDEWVAIVKHDLAGHPGRSRGVKKARETTTRWECFD
jgi:hypothetical protein